MPYVEPTTVVAPKTSIDSLEILYNTQDEGWSVARIRWEGELRVGIRWNGGSNRSGIGNPQSRGNATWFILPQELEKAVLDKVDDLNINAPGGLLDQYREMASDAQQEAEAEEWSEGLIGDASAEG